MKLIIDKETKELFDAYNSKLAELATDAFFTNLEFEQGSVRVTGDRRQGS